MKSKSHIIYRILSPILVLALFVPLAQSTFDLFVVARLRGAVENPPAPDWSFENWWKGDFQKTTDTWTRRNVGIAEDFIRINNQMKFSIFNQPSANSVIIGKENYLYELNYILACQGEDFKGEEYVRENARMAAELRDTLNKLGKELIIIIGPNKARYFNDYIPDHLRKEKTTTNREIWVDELIKKDVPHIDVSNWFMELKEEGQDLLYPKTGIHWSTLGLWTFTDSLTQRLDQLLGKDIPEWKFDSIEYRNRLSYIDHDIEVGMNLLWEIDKPEMPYPNILSTDSGKYKPSALIIGDSYWWETHERGYDNYYLENQTYLYYFRDIFPRPPGSEIGVIHTHIPQLISGKEFVILISTEPNLPNHLFGVVEELHEMYFNPEPYEKELAIQQHMFNIKHDHGWWNSIQQKAAEQSRPVDEILREDAEYIYWVELVNAEKEQARLDSLAKLP